MSSEPALSCSARPHDKANREHDGVPALIRALGVDHYMLAVMREKARFCAGDYLAEDAKETGANRHD